MHFPQIIFPSIFESFANLKAGQSTRLGGVSNAPFNSLNLGMAVNDEPQKVGQNRTIFFETLQTNVNEVVFSHQIHETQILEATQPGNYTGFDAQITNIANICLAVSIADCTPILIYDAHNKAIAAIHAGWKGTVGHIVSKTLAIMQQKYGTKGENCFAYIGTCISERNFEVNKDVADHFKENHKKNITNTQKFLVDLKAANTAQLLDFGIPSSQIEVSKYCTVANNDMFFSHRKEKGTTGRMLAAIKMVDQ